MSNKAAAFNRQRAIGGVTNWNSPEMDIYQEPFRDCLRTGAHVMIATYGISPVYQMKPVVDELQRCKCQVSLLLGYSKRTHQLPSLHKTLTKYRELGWKVYVLPGCHLKVWAIDSMAWVGSMNFVQQTAPNIMVQVPVKMISSEMVRLFKKAYGFNSSTRLELVPIPHP